MAAAANQNRCHGFAILKSLLESAHRSAVGTISLNRKSTFTIALVSLALVEYHFSLRRRTDYTLNHGVSLQIEEVLNTVVLTRANVRSAARAA